MISLENVGKRYVKYEDVPLLLTRALRFRAGGRRQQIWALRNIDLKVAPGESVGVIGRNGAGKSTMFRMLAGVTAPTEGVVKVNGRVAPLISVGVGFHPELTGRENVYVNAAILGLATREIDRRLDAIVDFAGIGEFLDTPVKFYSSGMFVRLGFSVAVAADPEILLVDEILSVGDVAFQQRCFERMAEIRRNGATVLVVSHNLNSIRQLCSRTMLLHNGAERFTGDTDRAISLYHDLLDEVPLDDEVAVAPGIQVKSFALYDGHGEPTAHIVAGDEVVFRVEAHFTEPAEHPVFGLFVNKHGTLIYGESNVERPGARVEAGQVVRCEMRFRASLPTGTYTAKAVVGSAPNLDAAKSDTRPLNFYVSGRRRVRGVSDLGASFDVTAHEPPAHSEDATTSTPEETTRAGPDGFTSAGPEVSPPDAPLPDPSPG